jgi:hypothetical protein
MEKTVDNVLIGVPCFGGQVQYKSANSLIQLDRLLGEHKINRQIRFVANDSLVCRARNEFGNVALFDTDSVGRKFSHLLFLDADVATDPADILTMLKADKPIIALPYAKKAIHWPSVVKAVQRGVRAEHLQHYSGDAVINSDKPFPIREITPIKHAGMGAMLIQVQVLKALADAHPERRYEMSAFEKSLRSTKETEAVDFFRAGIYPGTKTYLGEDYSFIEDARSAGFETYLIPWAQTVHSGSYEYRVNIPAVASLSGPFAAKV